MKYFLNPGSVDKSTKKFDVQKNAKRILKRLYPVNLETEAVIQNNVEPANLNVILSENPLIDELKECIRKSSTTAASKNLESGFDSLNKEFKLFVQTGI